MSRIFILARTVLPTPASFCPNLQILVSWDALDMLSKSNWRPFTAEARRWSQADSISAGLLWAKIEYPQHGGPGRVENPSEKAQGLEPVQTCWNLLEPVGTCWNLLEPVGTCWNYGADVMGLLSFLQSNPQGLEISRSGIQGVCTFLADEKTEQICRNLLTDCPLKIDFPQSFTMATWMCISVSKCECYVTL